MKNQQYLELAIPVLSFGATFVGVLLVQMGFEIAQTNFQYFAIGCVMGSCLLAYLAWCRPRKDIVALSTPIYGIVFFISPIDYLPGLILQMLYSVSLTILLIRLKYRFGTSHTAVSLGQELDAPLKAYAGQSRAAVSSVSPASAHSASVIISQFARGEYRDVARLAGTAISQSEGVPVLVRAFAIVREQALTLDGSLPRPEPYHTFLPEDEGILANRPHPEYSEDRKFDAQLDNALLLLFSAAWHGAEADRSHIISCQAFLLKLFA
ncbi:MAG: hypothetical protein CVV34_03815, partial [Methanomicrobiales archaeon HGW-Methanomicrobiales-5]